MDRKISLAVIGVVAVSCVVPFVTASSLTSTPLFTLRMEQMSSEKNFLPTEKNEFTYTSEKGFTLGYEISGYSGGVNPLMTEGSTCNPTCNVKTCITCLTCESCFHCVTVNPTCDDLTCQRTCNPTCDEQTCNGITCN